MLDFSLDTSYKSSAFSKTLPKKGLEFILNKRESTVIFNLGHMLLLTKVGLIPEKQGNKENVFKTYGIDCVKMLLVLSIKVIPLYMRATLVEVRVLELESSILGCEICFAILLAFNKQF